MAKHHILEHDPYMMVVLLTNLKIWRASVWCGLQCDADAFSSSVFLQFFSHLQKNRQISVDQNLLEKRRNEKCIDMVVCGIPFRFFWAVERQKRFRCRIGVRLQLNFKFYLSWCLQPAVLQGDTSHFRLHMILSKIVKQHRTPPIYFDANYDWGR